MTTRNEKAGQGEVKNPFDLPRLLDEIDREIRGARGGLLGRPGPAEDPHRDRQPRGRGEAGTRSKAVQLRVVEGKEKRVALTG